MTSGLLQGESVGKLATRFQNVTNANRVTAIRNARTFVTAAENAGRYDGFKEAERLGIKGIKKQWLATLDGRTRHSHRELDGQVVGWNEKFTSSLGSEMLYPGDKDGAKAGDLYNCRCTMITVEKSGIVAEEVKIQTEDGIISDMSFKEWKNWKKGLEKSSENGIIKANKTITGHAGTQKKSEPNDIIDRVDKDGVVTVRCFYGADGFKVKEIHTTNHNNPKTHPYGKNGEHIHVYKWDEKGKLKEKIVRELTETERKENANIL